MLADLGYDIASCQQLVGSWYLGRTSTFSADSNLS
jgi:hypothetical protein